MNKIIDKINQKENTILVCCIFIIFACIIFFFVIFSKEIEKDKFNYSDNLNENVITITYGDADTVNIALKDFSYYIIVAESNTQNQAYFLNDNDPVNYWELKTSPIANVRALTKDFCVDTCIKDNILYMEALKHNISLSEDEEEYLEDTSYEIYKSLTGEQVDTTDITLGDIVAAQRKIFIAEKYILSLLDDNTISNRNEVSSNGTYYLDKIKSQYTIKENDKILDELIFGSITVNTH